MRVESKPLFDVKHLSLAVSSFEHSSFCDNKIPPNRTKSIRKAGLSSHGKGTKHGSLQWEGLCAEFLFLRRLKARPTADRPSVGRWLSVAVNGTTERSPERIWTKRKAVICPFPEF